MVVLAWLGAAGAWIFVVVSLLDGWTRPGYRPVRHAVSALALGSRGWIQTANFILCGLLIMAGAAAFADPLGVAGVVMAGVFGAALVASGVFPMDPMRGYPPGTPDGTPKEVSNRHKAHDWAGTVVFGTLPLVALYAVFAVPGAGWKWYSGLTFAALVAGVTLFGRAWERDSAYAGLVQRVTIIAGWLWLGLMFAHAAGWRRPL